MSDQPRSYLDLLRARQHAAFIGRTEQLALFTGNLDTPVGDQRRRLLFNVFGDAGVGKSSLLEYWRAIAHDRGAMVAKVDEHVYGVPEMMAVLADQLGDAFRGFRAKYASYLKRRHQLERDPQVPGDMLSQVIRATVKGGWHVSRGLPVVGAITQVVDGDFAADTLDQVRTLVARKLRNSRDVRLVLSPVDELSPLFVAGLARLSSARPIALFFDTFEQIGAFAEGWLQRLIRGQFGTVSQAVTLTTAGRSPLDPGRWSEFSKLIATVQLMPFSESETRQFLAESVTDERTVKIITQLSGGLPLLVDMLARNRPTQPSEVDDPTKTAVEAFLKWETDGRRRAAALSGSLPRRVSVELLAAATGTEEVTELFGWLTGQPFVDLRAGRYIYHEVVRTPMLRMQLAGSPQGWRQAHLRLAGVYRRWRDELGADDEPPSPTWQGYKVEETYHLLCADPTVLRGPLLDAITAARQGPASARRWADVLTEAGRDAGNGDLRRLGLDLLARVGDEAADCLSYLSLLATSPKLDPASQAIAYTEIGRIHYQADHDDQAVEACTRALAYDPQCSDALAVRAAAYSYLGRHAEAVSDFEQALVISPHSIWAMSRYADARRMAGRLEEALVRFGQVLAIRPGDSWSLMGRAQTYQAMKRYDEAIIDLNHAIEVSEDKRWIYLLRGEIRHQMGQADDAISDLTHVIGVEPTFAPAYDARARVYSANGQYELAISDHAKAIEYDTDEAWFYCGRGETFRLMGRSEEALADFTHAIQVERNSAFALLSRGQTYQEIKQFDKAIQDFSRAIEVEPRDALGYRERARTYQALGQYEPAVADLTIASELSPDDSLTHFELAEIHLRQGRHDLSTTHLTRAIEHNSDASWLYAQRGEVHRLAGNYELAIRDFERAIELNATSVFAYGSRGQTYQAMGLHDQAIRDLTQAVRLKPDTEWALASLYESCRVTDRVQGIIDYFTTTISHHADKASLFAARGEVYRLKGANDQAIADFTRALDLDNHYIFAVRRRALTLRLVGHFEQAVADFTKAIELAHADSTAHAELAETYREMGNREEAVRCLDRAVELDPISDVAYGIRGQIHRALEQYDRAVADLSRAIELAPSASWLYDERGESYRLMGNNDQAVADFSRSVAIDPGNAFAYGSRGQAFAAMKEYTGALADLTKAVELDPSMGWCYGERGLIHEERGMYREALADFAHAIHINPTATWYGWRARTYRLIGRYDKATEDYTQAVSFDRNDAWVLAGLGETYRLTGRTDEALATFSSAIELDPSYAWPLSMRGTTYRQIGRLDDALADARQATTRDDADSSDHYFLATILLAANDPGASAAIRAAGDVATSELSREELSDIARPVLGLCAISSGNVSEGSAQLRTVIDKTSDLPTLMFLMEEIEFIGSLREERRMSLGPLLEAATKRRTEIVAGTPGGTELRNGGVRRAEAGG